MIESRVENENLECLYEGLEIDKKKSGFCRIVFQDGHYYIGSNKNGLFHGNGKLVLANGSV